MHGHCWTSARFICIHVCSSKVSKQSINTPSLHESNWVVERLLEEVVHVGSIMAVSS